MYCTYIKVNKYICISQGNVTKKNRKKEEDGVYFYVYFKSLLLLIVKNKVHSNQSDSSCDVIIHSQT